LAPSPAFCFAGSGVRSRSGNCSSAFGAAIFGLVRGAALASWRTAFDAVTSPSLA
jgi:hypothetical protein